MAFEDDSLFSFCFFGEDERLNGELSVLNVESVEGPGLEDFELVFEGDCLLAQGGFFQGDRGEDFEVLLSFLARERLLSLIEEELREYLFFLILQGLQLLLHLGEKLFFGVSFVEFVFQFEDFRLEEIFFLFHYKNGRPPTTLLSGASLP